MTIYGPDYPANWTPLANNSADSAWAHQAMSMFAAGGRVGTRPFAIKAPPEHMAAMARGGLAQQAKNVKDAGVGGDTMVIHINKDEYNQLCKEWGHPTINPHTGLPQWTPFWKQSWFAPVAALVGTALMATGVGASLGTSLFGTLGASEAGAATLGGATGISALGSVPVSTLAGNTLLGAGIGGLTGGGKGALLSGGLAGVGTIGASALGNYLGSGTPGTTSAGITAGMNADPMATLNAGADKILASNPSQFGYLATPETGSYVIPVSDSASAGGIGGKLAGALTGFATDPGKMAAAAVALGDLAGSSGGSSSSSSSATTPDTSKGGGDPNLTRHLAPVTLRTRALMPLGYYNYGSMPEQVFYNYSGPLDTTKTDTDTTTVKAAHGGPLTHYVQGGGTGRSDSIPAKLSDGEYVMDAETVALLGDGSSKAGAQRLDQFRANIRKQKGKALAQGKFSPDARSPEQYLMGGRA